VAGLEALRALWDYSGTARGLIGAAKDAPEGAQAWSLWQAAWPLLRGERERFQGAVFVPAPSSRRRPGGSLPLFLGRQLAQSCHGRLLPLLRRRPGRPPQSTLNGAERRANLRGGIALRRGIPPAPTPDFLRARDFWLVDDVATTGATLEECARTLRAAGAARVSAVVLARVP